MVGGQGGGEVQGGRGGEGLRDVRSQGGGGGQGWWGYRGGGGIGWLGLGVVGV